MMLSAENMESGEADLAIGHHLIGLPAGGTIILHGKTALGNHIAAQVVVTFELVTAHRWTVRVEAENVDVTLAQSIWSDATATGASWHHRVSGVEIHVDA